MIGDPLLTVERPATPPGVRHPNPAHRTAWRLLALCGAALLAWPVIGWLNSDEMPLCITLPIGAQYHGFDDSWWVDGHLIGHSPQEDSACIRPG